MAKNGSQRPVVSVIPLQDSDLGRRVLLQRRDKASDDTPYRGFLELPQGKVAGGESVSSFSAFKLENETGLKVVRYLAGGEISSSVAVMESQLHWSQPFCCVVDTTQNHFAVAVVALVAGKARQTEDAKGHRWLTAVELRKTLAEDKVFPLNRPMLDLLLQRSKEFELELD